MRKRLKKKKRIIKGLIVEENSLAACPANGRKFLITKEKGDGIMDLRSLMAFLSTRADVPEVVKEELAEFVPDNVDGEEVAAIFKELEIELPKEIEVKKEVVDTVKVGEGEMKVADLAESFESLQKEVGTMQKALLQKELTDVIGEKQATKLIDKYYGKLDKEEMLELADEMKGLVKLAEDTRGKPADTEENHAEAEINKEVERIQKEENCTRAEALIRLGEEKPELVGQWH